MFEALFAEISKTCPKASFDRPEGIAFFKATKALYRFEGICYLVFNIKERSAGSYTHCVFSDSYMRQKTSVLPLSIEKLSQLGLVCDGLFDWRSSERTGIELDMFAPKPASGTLQGASFAIGTTRGETALFGFTARRDPGEWEAIKIWH